MHNKALIGIILITILFIANIVYIGNKNFWFEQKNKYWTTLNSGDGVREGTLVTFSGLKVGEVMELSVNEDNRIRVTFTVRKFVAGKISRGSLVRVVRSMMIGEKKLEIVLGPRDAALIQNYGYIPGVDMREISDLLSGGEQLQRMMPQLERIVNNVDIITTSFANNPQMIEKLMKTLDEANILLRAMERSFLFKGNVQKIIEEDRKKELNKK
jgi:ABC-type transporter Mla subunit MlaD